MAHKKSTTKKYSSKSTPKPKPAAPKPMSDEDIVKALIKVQKRVLNQDEFAAVTRIIKLLS